MRNLILAAGLLCGLPALAQLGGAITAGVITETRGKVEGQARQGKPSALKKGQPVQAGMVIESSPDSDTVLAFPDGQIGVLGSKGNMRLNNYVYDLQNPAKNDINLNLIEGNLRVVMGEIGQANPSALRLQVGTASVGLQSSSKAASADASLVSLGGAVAVSVQEGQLEVRLPNGSVLRVSPGQTLYMNQNGTAEVDSTAKMMQVLSQSALGLQIQSQLAESRGFDQAIAQAKATMAVVNAALKNSNTLPTSPEAQQVLAALEELPSPGQTAQAELAAPEQSTASTPATSAGGGGTPCSASCN